MGGTGDENPQGKAEELEEEEENPEEASLTPHARRRWPPTKVTFDRPEESGDDDVR